MRRARILRMSLSGLIELNSLVFISSDFYSIHYILYLILQLKIYAKLLVSCSSFLNLISLFAVVSDVQEEEKICSL